LGTLYLFSTTIGSPSGASNYASQILFPSCAFFISRPVYFRDPRCGDDEFDQQLFELLHALVIRLVIAVALEANFSSPGAITTKSWTSTRAAFPPSRLPAWAAVTAWLLVRARPHDLIEGFTKGEDFVGSVREAVGLGVLRGDRLGVAGMGLDDSDRTIVQTGVTYLVQGFVNSPPEFDGLIG
jgi:hypothetical protein